MSEGLRYDQGKIRWDLLPYDGLHEVAKVSTVGSVKYAPRNWERGMPWSKMVACAMRHLFARMSGERLDPETGLPHLAHFAWNALALLAYDLRGVGENDIEECARGPRLEPNIVPMVSNNWVISPKPPKGGVTFTGDQSLTLDNLAEANPENEPYEGVTCEEGRLGCSFLKGFRK